MSKKREKPFHLDMSLDEALKRFVQTRSARTCRRKKKVKRRRNKSNAAVNRTTAETV